MTPPDETLNHHDLEDLMTLLTLKQQLEQGTIAPQLSAERRDALACFCIVLSNSIATGQEGPLIAELVQVVQRLFPEAGRPPAQLRDLVQEYRG